MKVRLLFTLSVIEWLQVCGFFMLTGGFIIAILMGLMLVFSDAQMPMRLVWAGLGLLIGLGALGALVAQCFTGAAWLRARLNVGRLRLCANPTAAKPGEIVTLTLTARDIDFMGRSVLFRIAFEELVDEAPNTLISRNEHPIVGAPPGRTLSADVIVPLEMDANRSSCVCIAYAIVDNHFALSAKVELKMLLADGVDPAPGIWATLKEIWSRPKKQ